MILKNLKNIISDEFGVLRELAILPACKSFGGAKPKCPVSRSQQTENVIRRKLLIRWRLPGNVLDSIEAEQAEFGAQPKITDGSLGKCVNLAFGKAVANLPRCVCVLTDIQRWIQSERARRPRQHHASQQNISQDHSY